jgi:5-methylcytosine-specific restriction enzyme A
VLRWVQESMTRQQFIESQGATCKNWMWSWSFINEAKRLIIFGAWDRNTNGKLAMILTDDWKETEMGRTRPGYTQSLEHVRLIQDENYRLMTFPMQYSEKADGSAKIEGFTPKLSEKRLIRIGNSWYAADPDDDSPVPLAEELFQPEKFFEGAKTTVTINAFERNPKARAACIAHHGCKCAVCGFDFAGAYGSIGEGFIHVHHIVPVGKAGAQYQIDPITDLRPVCPNCHAMLHRTEPVLTIEQLRNHLQSPNKGGVAKALTHSAAQLA